MSREDDFDDMMDSPDELDAEQDDSSEVMIDDVLESPIQQPEEVEVDVYAVEIDEEETPAAPSTPVPAKRKTTAKKKKTAAKPKAKAKKKKAAKPAGKPAARKTTAKKKKTAKKKARPAPKKKAARKR